MTLPPKTITVKCPQCEQVYIDWHVSPVGVQGPKAYKPSVVCSKCGHRAILEDLTEKDGVFQSPA